MQSFERCFQSGIRNLKNVVVLSFSEDFSVINDIVQRYSIIDKQLTKV